MNSITRVANMDFGKRSNRFVFVIHSDNAENEAPTHEMFYDRVIPHLTDRFTESVSTKVPFRYIVGQLERGGKTERLHLQGYLQVSGTVNPSVKAIYNLLKQDGFPTPYVDTSIIPRGQKCHTAESDMAAIVYCKNAAKEGCVCFGLELGEPLDNRHSTKLTQEELLRKVRDEIHNGTLPDEFSVNSTYPHVYSTKTEWVRTCFSEKARIRYIEAPRPTYVPFVWQYWLDKYLVEQEPHSRKIIYVSDPVGSAGKSSFATRFALDHRDLVCQVMSPSKTHDMAYMLDPNVHVLFIDVTRSKSEYIGNLPDFLEQVKDGRVTSSKYNGQVKHIGPVHVVVLTNDNVDSIVVGKGFTFNRYAIWSFEEVPELTRPWGAGSGWHTEFPCFKCFDKQFKEMRWEPLTDQYFAVQFQRTKEVQKRSAAMTFNPGNQCGAQETKRTMGTQDCVGGHKRQCTEVIPPPPVTEPKDKVGNVEFTWPKDGAAYDQAKFRREVAARRLSYHFAVVKELIDLVTTLKASKLSVLPSIVSIAMKLKTKKE